MNVLIPGGASYIGAYLVPHILAHGHSVTVYDTLYFGSGFLPKDNGHLRVVKADVRDQKKWQEMCAGVDAVIYLASISREMLCQQKPELARQINVDCVEPDIRIAKDAGVKRFIYASSVAIYGSSDCALNESSPIRPTTIYGEGKARAEEALWKHASRDFVCTATRSASVTGYSPRMRLDLTINRMVHDAYRKGKITVEGGSQIRSHIHMKDICDFYLRLLDADNVAGEAFNVVAENHSVNYSAQMVSRIMDCNVEVKPRVDDRSYAIDGMKANRVLDFIPKRPIEHAVYDLRANFKMGMWPDSETNPVYQNLRDDIA